MSHAFIKLRRGTAAEWAASQPQPGGEVLKLGEPGYEKDTRKLKIGDGVTPWNSLPYFSDGIVDFPEELQDIIGNEFLIAGSGIGINYDDSNNTLTIGLDNPTIELSDITDLSSNGRNFLLNPSSINLSTLINDETGSGLLVFNTNPAFSGIPTVPTAPSGTNSTQIANTSFVRTEISNLVDAAPVLLDTLNELAAALGDDANFATTITNSLASKANLNGAVFTGSVSIPSGTGNFNSLAVNGIPVSVSGHNHVYTDITNFASGVDSVLNTTLVEGDYIDLNYDSLSSTLTISADISGVIENIQDNLGSGFLVAGTGVQLTYNDATNLLTLNNLHTQINELSFEPQGFVNRTDSVISFDDLTRTFTITPTGSHYDVYINGVKVTKTTSESIVIPTGTALNYLHFDTDTYLLSNKSTFFNFDTDVPIAFIHWNSDINQSTFFGEERHGIRMDSMTHKWIHNTFGMQYINGLSIGGYVLLGDGSSNSHAQMDISDGTLYQEDIIINVTNGTGSGSFIQQLNPTAYIPVYYHSGTTGQWVRDTATAYPLKYNGTRALYNLYSGGTWTTPNVPNNRYFAMWIVATNDINDPILAIMGQREDSSLQSAENNNNWSDINLTNIPVNEIRPLYRLIFITNDTFTNTPKSSLQSILDLRKSIITSTYGVSQNDHGNLFGLGDDDHYQYIHINEARTIDAVHTFTNGLISSGPITIDGINVSVSGHYHMPRVITLTYGATLNTDANTGDIFDVTLTGNTTLANPTNPSNGQTIRWRITQDSTGGRGVTLGSKFVIPSTATSPLPFSTGSGVMDILAATYHLTRDKWDIIAFVPGY